MSPTITSPAMMTGVGMLLGTAAYMSPEQARGKAVDRHSDIWAFGCVIYEMVTGRRAFSGNEVSDVLASVLAREPDWTLMPRAMSPALGTFIRHCLQKDRKDRIGDAQTIRLALEGAFESQTAVTPKSPRKRLVWAFASLAMVTLVGAIALVVAARRPSTSVAEAQQFAIFPPEKASFSADSNAQAVSPDGRQIVFVASGSDGLPQLWIRRLDSLNARTLAGTDGATQPFWSPDSRSVGFFAAGKLKTISVEGGPRRSLMRRFRRVEPKPRGLF
jgi:serine/threonine protein kinase